VTAHSTNLVRPRQRGFTLVELCLGLLATAMIGSALAAFTVTIGKGWQASGGAQSTSLSSAAATLRIQEIVRNARLTGKCDPGALDGSASAAVLLWLEDTNGDGVIQVNECAMIEYDSTSRCIIKRTVPSSGSTASMNYATFSSSSTVLSNFRGDATVTQPVARDIDGALFSANAGDGSTDLPIFEFSLKFQRTQARSNGQTETVGSPLIGYGVAAVRTPLQRPS
jgi:type II secretory pathway pseudopilin PulG